MSKWDRLRSGLIIIVMGIYGSIVEFYFTEKIGNALGIIFLGLSFEVVTYFNILPLPAIREKILEKELEYDEATRVRVKKQQKKINQIMIILGVVGLAILGYQWFTDSDYKSYSAFGFSFEYPEEMGEVTDRWAKNNEPSTVETGLLYMKSDTEHFGIGWRSDINGSYIQNSLDGCIDSLEVDVDLTDIQYVNYTVSGFELVTVRAQYEIDTAEFFIIMGFGFCEHSERLFGIQYGTFKNDSDLSTFNRFLENFECSLT